jgi:hypothetical protein
MSLNVSTLLAALSAATEDQKVSLAAALRPGTPADARLFYLSFLDERKGKTAAEVEADFMALVARTSDADHRLRLVEVRRQHVALFTAYSSWPLATAIVREPTLTDLSSPTSAAVLAWVAQYRDVFPPGPPKGAPRKRGKRGGRRRGAPAATATPAPSGPPARKAKEEQKQK